MEELCSRCELLRDQPESLFAPGQRGFLTRACTPVVRACFAVSKWQRAGTLQSFAAASHAGQGHGGDGRQGAGEGFHEEVEVSDAPLYKLHPGDRSPPSAGAHRRFFSANQCQNFRKLRGK